MRGGCVIYPAVHHDSKSVADRTSVLMRRVQELFLIWFPIWFMIWFRGAG